MDICATAPGEGAGDDHDGDERAGGMPTLPPPPPAAAAMSLGDPPSPGGFLAAGRRAGCVRGGVGESRRDAA